MFKANTPKEQYRMAASDQNFYHNPSRWSKSEAPTRKSYNQFVPNHKVCKFSKLSSFLIRSKI